MAVDAVVVPDEIIVEEILTRVAVKSLVRFRCVCKSWNSQLYNPNFLSRFNHHHRSSSVSPELIRDDDDDDYLLFMNTYQNEKTGAPYGSSILSCKKLSETCLNEIHNYVPYPLSLGPYSLELVGSINGLVCMAFNYYCNHEFVLWNPIIRFSKKISMVGIDINRCYPLVFGFGWDSVTNDYKLIASPNPKYHAHRFLPAAVYSCKTDSWSNINSVSISLVFSAPSVIVNGSPYWYDLRHSIQKFDIPNNEFTCLTAPAPSQQLCYHSRFILTKPIKINDCLAFLEYNTYRGVAKVYRYDEQHNIWMNMYTFDKYVNHDEFIVDCFNYGGQIVFHGKKYRYLYDPNKSREVKSPLRRCPRCGGCLDNSSKRKCRGDEDEDEGEGDGEGYGYKGGHVVNGFSYTPSLVALPGMKALHMKFQHTIKGKMDSLEKPNGCTQLFILLQPWLVLVFSACLMPWLT